MADNVVTSTSHVPASEILSQTISTILETIHAAKAVLIQKENFQRFSAYLEKITFVLKELSNFVNDSSKRLKNFFVVLNNEVSVAKLLALECCNRNKVYLLLNSRNIVKELERSSKEISRGLGLIKASLDLSSGISDEINELCERMLDAEYRAAKAEEEILEKIEIGIRERNVERSYANSLVIGIAKAVGISTEQPELRKEYEDFKSEIDNVDLRKDTTEALQMEQILALLGKADVIATTEEREKKYFNKRNSLGRQPLEPLQSFYCPITGDIMEDPVETSSGHSFERSAIEKWLADGNNLCPLTKTPLQASALRTNRTLWQSIEEWRKRNTIIIIASMKPKIQSNEEQEVIHYLTKLQDLCMESDLHREWVIMEDYIPVLVALLSSKNSEIRSHVLVILRVLAEDSDNRKERIANMDGAIEPIVFSLARKVEESKLALQLLLELSRTDVVRNTIGSIQGCILLLVTLSGSDDVQAAEDAGELLQNLSFLHQNVIQMAKANYCRPLLHLLSSGPESVQKVMAKTLSEVEMTDYSKLSLCKDGALVPLLRMLSHSDIEMKKVAIAALQNLSSVQQNALQMIKEGAVGPLFEILFRHSLSLPCLVEQVVSTIMHLALSTTEQGLNQEKIAFLESEEDVFKFFSLISLMAPEVQENVLRTFHAMCQSPTGLDIRTTLRKLSAVQVLVQLFELENQTVRANAVKLFCCLTKDGDDNTFLEHVGLKCIDTLIRIIKYSNNVEEIVAAIDIISNLPRDRQISQWLFDSGTLQVILDFLTTGYNNFPYKRELIIESASGALCRFTGPTDPEMQKKVAETGIITILVQLLASGTALTKQNIACSLGQLSKSSSALTIPVEKKGLFRCCLGSPETICTLHMGTCTLESSFCLLEADAVRPLVRVLGEPDIGACEASLEALLTLIEGELLQRGSKVLDEGNAIATIIKLLSSSSPNLQERALGALERIFRLHEFKEKYKASAQMPLVEITQRGSSALKSLAAKILAHLNVLHDQSSFF